MIHRSFKYRLTPANEQKNTLAQWAGATRLVYNLALEQRRDWWRQYLAATGGRLNYASQGRQITDLRREYEWIEAAPSTCLTQALRDLDRAFANFFSGRGGFPAPRKRGVNDAFRLQGKETKLRRINRRWAEVRLPKLGWVRFRITRPMLGDLVSVTVSRDSLGWHASFACAIKHEAPANDNPAVGVDRGVAATLALSTGERMATPDISILDGRLRRAKRVVSRRKIGSKRRMKALRRSARIAGKIARVRACWQHRTSTDIAGRFGAVALEDLNIQNMTARGKRKSGLNRSILGQGWGGFATKLAYKLEERGGALVKVNPAYTSQTCSDCGAIDSDSRKSQASFVCTSCGFAINADHNAALIILRRSTPVMPVEGRGCAPVEAGTCLVAA